MVGALPKAFMFTEKMAESIMFAIVSNMFPNSNILFCLKIKYPKNPPVKNAIVW